MSMQSSQRQRVARGGEEEERAVFTLVRFGKTSRSLNSPHCPEKSKAGCGGSCSESVPTATGVLMGVPTGVLMGGCGVASAAAKVFS